jgi:uncharacterized protein YlzI (FlbEa/FlbD family)
MVMKRLVRLSHTGGGPVYVNPDHIVKLEPQHANLAGEARLTLVVGDDLVLDQTVDQILEQIDSLAWRGHTGGSDVAV